MEKPSAARCGPIKLHYATGPGLAGCDGCVKQYYDPPLVFNVEVDPSEQFPLAAEETTDVRALANASLTAYMTAYTPGTLDLANGGKFQQSQYTMTGLVPDLDSEIVNGNALYGICCDRQQANSCQCDGAPYAPL